MRNRVRYLVKNVLDELYTLGKNVKKGQLQREMKRLTNRKESHFIHTSTTKVRYERAMMKFCDYLEEVGIKRESHLKKVSTEELKEIIDDYFRQIVDEGYSKGTIKIHISAMKKSFAIIRPDIKDYLDEKRVDWWSAGQEHKKGDSYMNPEVVREHLEETHRAIAEAQSLGGFRIREIARTEIDRENKTITIRNAKGGRTRTLYFQYREEKFEKLVDLIEKLKEQEYTKRLKDYYEDLKKACEATNEEYNASHAFRFEYAQTRAEELRNNKEELKDLLEKYNADEKTKQAANSNDEREVERAIDHVLTRELGHNRSCMARYYYKR